MSKVKMTTKYYLLSMKIVTNFELWILIQITEPNSSMRYLMLYASKKSQEQNVPLILIIHNNNSKIQHFIENTIHSVDSHWTQTQWRKEISKTPKNHLKINRIHRTKYQKTNNSIVQCTACSMWLMRQTNIVWCA